MVNPMTDEGRDFQVADGLTVTEVGSGSTLVLFVHGAMGWGRSFDRAAEHLGPDLTMWWYDRRGYGTASKAPGTPATVPTHIEDILTILDGRRAVLIGHSFGGVSVLGAAVRAHEQIEAIGLYETPIAWAPGWDDSPLQRVFRADDPVETGLRMLFGERLDAMTEERQAQLRLDGIEFIAEELSVRTGTPPYDLTKVVAPVTYGRTDAGMLPVVVDYLQKSIPHFDVVDLPGAGHHAHRTDPAAFAGLVRRACDSVVRD
jgi:pimeloyl-ACP methyl ester carboxylesterase